MSFENEAKNDIGSEILGACANELYMAMPYLAEALYALRFVPGGGVTDSAATNGRELYYSDNYLKNLYLRSSVRSNRAYLHIILHCMLRHLSKRRGKDGELWDLACDAAVESVTDSLQYQAVSSIPNTVRNIFYGQCLENMKVITAEGVYRMLLRERRPEYEIAKLQREFACDDHSLWDAESSRESEQNDERWKSISSKTKTAMETSLSEQAEGGEGMLERLTVAARDDVDYRAFLRRFASPREVLHCDDDAFDYIYYTYGLRRYGNMPLIESPETKEEKRIEDFVIAVDTSMSTYGDLVREFLRCTYSILLSTETFTRKLNIRIIQCDNQIRSDVRIENLDQLKKYMDSFELSGGSATDFRPVFDYVDELRAQGAFTSLRGIIYFTDGMGIYPGKRPDYDAAFVLLEEPPLEFRMPPWCIRIMLGITGLEKAAKESEELYQEELVSEMPEL